MTNTQIINNLSKVYTELAEIPESFEEILGMLMNYAREDERDKIEYLMTRKDLEEERGIELLEDERQTDYSYLKIDQ